MLIKLHGLFQRHRSWWHNDTGHSGATMLYTPFRSMFRHFNLLIRIMDVMIHHLSHENCEGKNNECIGNVLLENQRTSALHRPRSDSKAMGWLWAMPADGTRRVLWFSHMEKMAIEIVDVCWFTHSKWGVTRIFHSYICLPEAFFESLLFRPPSRGTLRWRPFFGLQHGCVSLPACSHTHQCSP